MSKYWSDLVSQLQPYVPGEQPDIANVTKLNTNENPYGPSPQVASAIQQLLNDDLRLYPPPNADGLRQTIADYYQLDPKQVFLGNGSDEVLAHVFNGLLKKSEPLLFPDISYSFYPVFCQLYGISFEQIPLTEDLSLAVEDYSRPNGGIIFPNPNAPTGRLLGLDAIDRLLKDNPDSVVVIDEAYIDFGGETAVPLIELYANLLVVQTMSKSRSLAGMRIGYAMGSVDLIEGLERIKNSFNSYPLGHLPIAAGMAAFEDQKYFKDTCQRVINSRDRLTNDLLNLGFEVMSSAGNFIFVCHADKAAEELVLSLRQNGIIVRHFKQPRIEQFLRVTIGTKKQNEHLVSVLTFLLGS
ncbi:MAG: histidinol-phosphate transaminase [Porticoccaceae bacterium]|nr:histidinol-phosphate transaminase [Porticoccaceae bacterium]MBT6421462.1 histidinol-phosphate transaminase [Porticoccaceae bacterium]